jgi:uncharacterized protein YggT (Ycf19 family)
MDGSQMDQQDMFTSRPPTRPTEVDNRGFLSTERWEYAAPVLAIIAPFTTVAAFAIQPTVLRVIGVGASIILAAVAAAGFAKQKGRSPVGFFLLGLAAPYVALVIALIINLGTSKHSQVLAQELGRALDRGPPTTSRADEVSKLADLHARAILTDEEFSEAKRRTLGL